MIDLYLLLSWRVRKVEKLLLFVEIHQLKRQGFKVAAIAKKLEISRNTVYKYLDMTLEEASEWILSLGSRSKKLDPYLTGLSVG